MNSGQSTVRSLRLCPVDGMTVVFVGLQTIENADPQAVCL